jgi:hypothetical protein
MLVWVKTHLTAKGMCWVVSVADDGPVRLSSLTRWAVQARELDQYAESRDGESDPVREAHILLLDACGQLRELSYMTRANVPERWATLQNALRCINAATLAIRFALVKEGDCMRRARAHGCSD